MYSAVIHLKHSYLPSNHAKYVQSEVLLKIMIMITTIKMVNDAHKSLAMVYVSGVGR